MVLLWWDLMMCSGGNLDQYLGAVFSRARRTMLTAYIVLVVDDDDPTEE
ncbi:hypothetical protein Slin14017_G097210 [Septoria linicola]|nr:hypothetical protein Slin14017_G097210 [Septoria linicola]